MQGVQSGPSEEQSGGEQSGGEQLGGEQSGALNCGIIFPDFDHFTHFR